MPTALCLMRDAKRARACFFSEKLWGTVALLATTWLVLSKRCMMDGVGWIEVRLHSECRRRREWDDSRAARLAACVMNDLFERFFERPTRAHYQRARQLVLTQPDYAARALDLALLGSTARAEDPAGVLAQVQGMMPVWALSPRTHFLAGTAAAELGDADEAELRQFLSNACLQGIAATGDGSEEQPLLVTHVEDEYDVLMALGQEVAAQRLVDNARGYFDVLRTSEGEEFWFNVTDILQRTGSTRRAHQAAVVRAGQG